MVPSQPLDDGLARAIQRAAGLPFSPGNQVTLLIDGEATYQAMHAQIASARHTIHLENYIIRDDGAGRGFAEALSQQARAGIQVRVLYDWLGSHGTSRRFWRELREAGVDARAFGPPLFSDPLVLIARDHRKLLVVDGACAVSGGLCIGDEWLSDPAKGREGWRDTALEVRGPAAKMLDDTFRRSWQVAGGPAPQRVAVDENVANGGGTAGVQIIATEPGRERASRAIDLLVGSANERLWITDAYLAVSQRLFQSFQDAARDGVDVRLLLPGMSDIRLVQQMTRAGYRSLLRAGVRIWEWDGPMLHAKTILADGSRVRVGSSNLNPSSLLANWELDILVDNDQPLADALGEQYLNDLGRSHEVVLRAWRRAALARTGVPPLWLGREKPSAPVHTRHRPAAREIRRRAMVAAGGLIRGARAAIFGPIALVLLLLALLYALFPQPMAWASTALSASLGIALLVRAVGHRSRG